MIALALGAAFLAVFCAAMIWFGRSASIRLDRRSERLLAEAMASLHDEKLALLLARPSDPRTGGAQSAPAHFRKG